MSLWEGVATAGTQDGDASAVAVLAALFIFRGSQRRSLLVVHEPRRGSHGGRESTTAGAVSASLLSLRSACAGYALAVAVLARQQQEWP